MKNVAFCDIIYMYAKPDFRSFSVGILYDYYAYWYIFYSQEHRHIHVLLLMVDLLHNLSLKCKQSLLTYAAINQYMVQ